MWHRGKHCFMIQDDVYSNFLNVNNKSCLIHFPKRVWVFCFVSPVCGVELIKEHYACLNVERLHAVPEYLNLHV